MECYMKAQDEYHSMIWLSLNNKKTQMMIITDIIINRNISFETEGIVIHQSNKMVILRNVLNEKINFKDQYKTDLIDDKGKVKKEGLLKSLKYK